MPDRAIPAGNNYPKVQVSAGWQPDRHMFGAGQVIKVIIDGVEQVATVTSAMFTGWADPLPSHLYLPERDEYVWVELVGVGGESYEHWARA